MKNPHIPVKAGPGPVVTWLRALLAVQVTPRLMMLGAGQGAEVMIEAEGWDAKEALEAVAGLVEAGFHED